MTPWVTRLIIANVVVFLLTMGAPMLQEQLMFVPALILARPWTVVTYMFVHAGFSHIFFNMLALFFFGPRVEFSIGSKSFLWLYFISGIMGAVLSTFLMPRSAIVGASGAIFGVMFAFAYFWPSEPIYIWGLLPIPAKWLVVAMTALSLFGGFTGSTDGTAHFAHLGGFLGGYLYLRFLSSSSRASRRQQQEQVVQASQSDLERWRRIPRDRMHSVNAEEYDRIFRKIDTQGVQYLTRAEREFLDRFSQL